MSSARSAGGFSISRRSAASPTTRAGATPDFRAISRRASLNRPSRRVCSTSSGRAGALGGSSQAGASAMSGSGAGANASTESLEQPGGIGPQLRGRAENGGRPPQAAKTASAIVTLAAGRRGLAKRREQSLLAAIDRGEITRQDFRALGRRRVDPGDFMPRRAQGRDLSRIVDRDGLRRPAVASGASGLLIKGFEMVGRVAMDDIAHVGLVDAQPEGDGRDHDAVGGGEKSVLTRRPLAGFEAGVKGHGRVAGLGEGPRQRIGGFAHAAIDDAAAPFSLGRERQDPAGRIALLRQGGQRDGLAVERSGDDLRRPGKQRCDDVSAGARAGRGGRSHRLGTAQSLPGHGNPAIVRPEIMAPLRDAMGFVDRQQADVGAAQQRDGLFAGQTFRRKIEQAKTASLQRVADPAGFAGVLAGMKRRRGKAERPELRAWSRIRAISGDTTTVSPGRISAGNW